MFQAPPFFLILSFNLLHSPLLHAIPVGEEQRHQSIHRDSQSESAHPFQLEGQQEVSLARNQQETQEATEDRPEPQLRSPSAPDDGDELFKDISPKALAAVLLQALNGDGEEQTSSTLDERNPSEHQQPVKEEETKEGLTERVRSRTRSSENEEEGSEDEKMVDGGDLESVKSLLQELEGFESPPKREQQPSQDIPPDNEDLEELRELLGLDETREEEKRTSQKPVLQSSRTMEGEENSDKLAGVAQDLLLQYLLNEGGNEEEQSEEEVDGKEDEEDDYQGDDFMGGQRPLFEDEEGGNIQDKRSTEDYGDEVDPQTIDKLIELSSRLHLPADDVVDIINDVEKRKRRRMKKKKARDDFLIGRKDRTRTPQQSWQDIPKPAYYPRRRLQQEPIWNKASQPVWNKISDSTWKKMQQPYWKKAQEPTWNRVKSSSWKNEQKWNTFSEPNWNEVQDSKWNKMPDSKWNKVQDSKWNGVQDSNWNNMQDSNWNSILDPMPRRYRKRPSSFNNYIRPRAFQTPPRYYYKPPFSQRNDYYDEDQDKQEEMENYIERILLTHPEVFQ
ncbi:neurosecretory protein VGF isoform 2-T2 [Pelodytes ibericus]